MLSPVADAACAVSTRMLTMRRQFANVTVTATLLEIGSSRRRSCCPPCSPATACPWRGHGGRERFRCRPAGQLHSSLSPILLLLIAMCVSPMSWCVCAAQMSGADRIDGGSGVQPSFITGLPDGSNCTCSSLSECASDSAMIPVMYANLTLCVCLNESDNSSSTADGDSAEVSCIAIISALVDLRRSTATQTSRASPTREPSTSTGGGNTGNASTSDAVDGWLGVAWWYWLVIISVAACLLTALLSILCTAHYIRKREDSRIIFNKPSTVNYEGRYYHMKGKNGSVREVIRNRGSISSETSFSTKLPSQTVQSDNNSSAGAKCSYAAHPAPSESNGIGSGNSGSSLPSPTATSGSFLYGRVHSETDPEPGGGTVETTSVPRQTTSVTSESENSGGSSGGYMYMAKQAEKRSRAEKRQKQQQQQQQQQRKVDTIERPLLHGRSESIAHEEEYLHMNQGECANEAMYSDVSDLPVFGSIDQSNSPAVRRSLKKNRAPTRPTTEQPSDTPPAPRKPSTQPPGRPPSEGMSYNPMLVQQRLQEQKRLQQQRRLGRRHVESTADTNSPATNTTFTAPRTSRQSSNSSHGSAQRSLSSSRLDSAAMRLANNDSTRRPDRQPPAAPVNSGAASRLSMSNSDIRGSGPAGSAARKTTPYHTSNLFPPSSDPHTNMAAPHAPHKYPISHSG